MGRKLEYLPHPSRSQEFKKLGCRQFKYPFDLMSIGQVFMFNYQDYKKILSAARQYKYKHRAWDFEFNESRTNIRRVS